MSFLLLAETEPRTLSMLAKHATSELQTQPYSEFLETKGHSHQGSCLTKLMGVEPALPCWKLPTASGIYLHRHTHAHTHAHTLQV